MPGIAGNTAAEFAVRVRRFAQQYVQDWNEWLKTPVDDRTARLGEILRRWQACRPNRMRRCAAQAEHPAPYLETLVENGADHVVALASFELRDETTLSHDVIEALHGFWGVFEQLSYRGPARAGLAGIVGISKAALLLTNGKVGPAFDSQVRANLSIGEIRNPETWIQALRNCQCDVRTFESTTQQSLQRAVPEFADVESGRIYDMALGPAGI